MKDGLTMLSVQHGLVSLSIVRWHVNLLGLSVIVITVVISMW